MWVIHSYIKLSFAENTFAEDDHAGCCINICIDQVEKLALYFEAYNMGNLWSPIRRLFIESGVAIRRCRTR